MKNYHYALSLLVNSVFGFYDLFQNENYTLFYVFAQLFVPVFVFFNPLLDKRKVGTFLFVSSFVVFLVASFIATNTVSFPAIYCLIFSLIPVSLLGILGE